MLIDNALAAPPYILKFPPALEIKFGAEGRGGRLRYQRQMGFLGIGLLLVSTAGNAEVIPDVFRQNLIYYALTSAAATAFLFMLRPKYPTWLTNVGALLYTLPGLLAQIILFATTHSPYKVYFINSSTLIIMFTNVSMQQRVPWLAAGGMCQIVIMLAGLSLSGIPAPAWYAQAAISVAAVLLSLMIAHRFEWRSRRAWLFRVRDALSHACLLELSERDGLTGLANRRAIDDRLNQAWTACVDGDDQLAIILLDVDWFKAFNDRYGHPAGDCCLRAIGNSIAGHVRRQGDLAGRYGGEEFILVLPGADAATSYAIAERVRDAIQALQIPHEAGPPGAFVTASLGVAVVEPSSGGSLVTLLSAADAALYEAKRNGRARVECAQVVG